MKKGEKGRRFSARLRTSRLFVDVGIFFVGRKNHHKGQPLDKLFCCVRGVLCGFLCGEGFFEFGSWFPIG